MLRLNTRKIKWSPNVPIIVILNITTLLYTLTNCQFINQRAGGHPSNFEYQKELAMRNQKAKEVLQLMNREANPCNDFFDYACGKWTENHAPTRIGEIRTPQSEMEARANKDLQDLYNVPNKHNTPAEQKVLSFYQSCLAVESASPFQNKFMVNFIKQLGGIPSMPSTNWHNNYDWLQIVTQLRARYGLNILINFEIGPNLDTMRENAVYLGEPKTTIIPPDNCSAVAMETMDLRDEGYEALQEEISVNMQRWISMRESDARRFGGDVIRFEFELCKKMRMEQSLPDDEEEETEKNEYPRNSRRNQMNNQMGQNRLYGRRVVGEIPRYGLSQLRQFEGSIDLERYVRTVLGTPYNEQIYIRSEQYLKHLAHIVKGTEKPTIANYLMYRALSELNFPSDDSSTLRPAYCVRQLQKYFPKIVGAVYTRNFQRNDLEQEVNDQFYEITKAFDESLEAEWITEQTKRAARQKLAQFKPRFPVYQNLDLSDLSIERIDYWSKLDVIMQYNARDKNAVLDTIESYDVATKLMPIDSEVLVGWALLQPPIYSNYYPRALRYATLGQRLARELAMAFDEQGWRPSPLSKQPLDEFTAQGLKNRTECYRTQYSNYLYNNPEDFRNASRLREIIADSNGLNLAFKAYLNWLKSIDSRSLAMRAHLMRETLPTADFTNTQLYFIHFAQSRCAAKFGEEPPPAFLPLDKHTPERYDVNGPLSNFIEFAREFGCSPGDEMHPDDKCVIY